MEVEQDRKLKTGSIKDIPQFAPALSAPTIADSYHHEGTTPKTSSFEEFQFAHVAEEDNVIYDSDDLEEADLTAQMAFLSMRLKNFTKRTGRKPGYKGQGRKVIGSFDTLKMKCYNCNRLGHIAADCRSPKNSTNQASSSGTKTTQPSKKASSQTHKGFYSEEVEWQFNDEDGETYAFMAKEVNESDCSSEYCSSKIKELVQEIFKLEDRLTVQRLSSQELLDKKDARLEKYYQMEKDWDRNYVRFEAEKKELQEALSKAVSELEINKNLVETWSKSSKDLQKMLSQQIHSKEKYGFGYHVTEAPTDYTPCPKTSVGVQTEPVEEKEAPAVLQPVKVTSQGVQITEKYADEGIVYSDSSDDEEESRINPEIKKKYWEEQRSVYLKNFKPIKFIRATTDDASSSKSVTTHHVTSAENGR